VIEADEAVAAVVVAEAADVSPALVEVVVSLAVVVTAVVSATAGVVVEGASTTRATATGLATTGASAITGALASKGAGGATAAIRGAAGQIFTWAGRQAIDESVYVAVAV
jgi:hypothetical protein